MHYFLLSPEVAGGLGPNTMMNRMVHPPEVSRLHYEMEGWLGDELLESFPCFIVTQRVADAIQDAHLTGAGFDGDHDLRYRAAGRLSQPQRSLSCVGHRADEAGALSDVDQRAGPHRSCLFPA